MIGVTGASGHYGRLVIEDLIKRGTDPHSIVALVRDPAKVKDLAARGVEVRAADYNKPESLNAALKGVERLLLVSGNEVGQRVPQHRNVVEASRRAGVKRLVYTSILKADSSPMLLAKEHRETEELIQASGLPFVILRNSWYIENYADQIPNFISHGVILGSAGQGRVSAATRADFAAAGAAVLLGRGPSGSIFELGGESFTLSELASEVSKLSGKTIPYQNVPEADYKQVLIQAGLPEAFAGVLADSDTGIAGGYLFTESQDLAELIGRPVTRLRDALAKA